MSNKMPLQQIQDRQAIVDLNIGYAWVIDHGPRAGLREIFTEDVAFTIRELGVDPDGGSTYRDNVINGVDDVIAKIDGSLGRLSISQHLVSNQQVEIDGNNARCRCYLHAQHTLHGTEGGDNFIMAGRYLDQLTRTDAGWRISQRELIIDWTEGNPKVLRR